MTRLKAIPSYFLLSFEQGGVQDPQFLLRHKWVLMRGA